MGTKWQKFEIDLSDYSVEEREAIAIEVIDKIIKRTKQGKDKDGATFAPYSTEYRNSQNFKNGGKSGAVNLVLSGDMLDSISILKNAAGKVSIGFDKGSAENGKADGNIRGTFGHSKTVGPKRDFLGISDDELETILRRYPPDSKKSDRRTFEVLTTRAEADRLSGAVNVDDLEE